MTAEKAANLFYTAFAKGDAETMTSLYDDSIEFKDPVFGKLKGMEAKMMWHMLSERSKGNLKVSHKLMETTENTAKIHWTAIYPFSKTGRIVTNHIKATMIVENGKITQHTDSFSLWNWSSQALGWKGLLLGWTPAVQSKIRTQSRAMLYTYLAKK